MFCRCPRIRISLLDRTTKHPHQLIERRFSFFDFFCHAFCYIYPLAWYIRWNKIMIYPLAWIKKTDHIWVLPRGQRYTDTDQKWLAWKTRQLNQVATKASAKKQPLEELEDQRVTVRECSPSWDTKISKVNGIDDPENCIYIFGSRTCERIRGKRTSILSLSLISIW